MTVKVAVEQESWPIAGSFRISRGSKNEAVVVTVALSDGEFSGRGECVPYSRYGESAESVIKQINSVRGEIERGLTRDGLQNLLTAGAARNAVDCAMWDLEAKKTGTRATTTAGFTELTCLTTAYTLSLDEPDAMGEAAFHASNRPLIKVKLGGHGDHDRITAVRKGAPESKLIADANESWNKKNFKRNLNACEDAGVELIEQPFPANQDEMLLDARSEILFCADESVHTAQDIPSLAHRYQAVNIKLDKSGGLTEALHMKKMAVEAGFKVMVGCMLATSLAMAPAMIVAQGTDYVDLDGPLLLTHDRKPGIVFEGSNMLPPTPVLWG